MSNGKPWSNEEDRYLQENYLDRSHSEMAAYLGRSTCAVKNRGRILGLKKREMLTEADLDLIREQYPVNPTEFVANLLGRSMGTIHRAAHRIGVKKDPEFLLRQLKEQGKTLNASGRANRFPKGHVPANKGLRRPGWSAGRMSETQFKKGHKPHNHRPGVGHERVCSKDGYIYIKVTDGRNMDNYRLKHRVVWEQHYGPIPPSHVVAFKDDNKQNCDISNLELISRNELALRNQMHHRYPEDVRQLIHTMAGFRRRLNDYAKKQNRGSEEHTVRDDGTVDG